MLIVRSCYSSLWLQISVKRTWVEADEVYQTPDKNLDLEKEEVDCSRLVCEQYIEKTLKSHACEVVQLADGRFQLLQIDVLGGGHFSPGPHHVALKNK